MKYGADKKGCFWINDTEPRMIMHPYRIDLEGKELREVIKDSARKRLFVEFLEVVKESGGGYVNYQWLWQDDPTRIISKVSYVQ